MVVRTKLDGSPITFRLADKNRRKSTKKQLVFELQIIPHDVVILHPSFCCPQLLAQDQKISVFILTDKEFYQQYDREKDPEKPFTLAEINRLLKIYPWQNRKQLTDVPLLKDKTTATQYLTITYIHDMLDKVVATSDPDDAGDELGDGLDEITVKEWRIQDKNQKLFARLRESSRQFYLARKVQYLFHIEIDHRGLNTSIKADALYDIAWLLPNKKDNKSQRPYWELQDTYTRDFISQHNNGRQQAYEINGSDFVFKEAPDSPVEAYHPFYVSSKDKLNIGHLTDVHVSSRQFALQASEAQVLQGLTTKDVSQKTGTLVNVTFNTLKDLIDELVSKGADALVVTGDLVDFSRNLDPAFDADWLNTFKKPGQCWDAMHDKHHKDNARYPKYIDDHLIFSLFLYCYTKHGRPVYLTSGNHEAYSSPYGISPRVGKFLGLKPKGLVKANEGIPADHNLTIYEAILTYGPRYNHLAHQFKVANLEWFYTVFTPFTDFVITYKDQCLVGLAWGGDEDILSNFNALTLSRGGTLPTASEAIEPEQYEIVQAAVAQNKQTLLATHFTFVNYANSVPLTQPGSVNYNNTFKTYGQYDHGSFKARRFELYDLLKQNKLFYTLSGHSHRAGLYETQFDDSKVRHNMQTRGHALTEQSMDPTELSAAFDPGPRVLVSGCGGPIAVQHHYGEGAAGTQIRGLKNWGLDWPSASLIKFNGDEDSLQRILPKNTPTAQPRFAVALDFVDLLEYKVFIHFESGENETRFNVVLNEQLPEQQFIETLSLYAYPVNEWLAFPLEISNRQDNRFVAAMSKQDNYKFEEDVIEKKNKILFLSIKFNNNLEKEIGYQQYNFGSNWNFQIQMNKIRRVDYDQRTGEEIVVKGPGYHIRRHKKFGEVPNFDFYTDNFSSLYMYDDEI